MGIGASSTLAYLWKVIIRDDSFDPWLINVQLQSIENWKRKTSKIVFDLMLAQRFLAGNMKILTGTQTDWLDGWIDWFLACLIDWLTWLGSIWLIGEKGRKENASNFLQSFTTQNQIIQIVLVFFVVDWSNTTAEFSLTHKQRCSYHASTNFRQIFTVKPLFFLFLGYWIQMLSQHSNIVKLIQVLRFWLFDSRLCANLEKNLTVNSLNYPRKIVSFSFLNKVYQTLLTLSNSYLCGFLILLSNSHLLNLLSTFCNLTRSNRISIAQEQFFVNILATWFSRS